MALCLRVDKARNSMLASMSLLLLLAIAAVAADSRSRPNVPNERYGREEIQFDLPIDDEMYLGCYSDTWDHLLQDVYAASSTNMTISQCRTLAKSKGALYYGLKGGNECFGGSETSRLMGPVPGLAECNMTCSGNSSEICGGSETLSVYITPRGPRSPPPPQISPGCYVGCFEDSPNNRTLAKLADESDDMTINRCRETARTQGFAYFGVEAGRQCFVGNEVTRKRTSNAVICNYRCAGDGNQICGGDWTISVYHSYDPNRPASPRPPPPSLRKEDYLGCFYDTLWFRVLPQSLDVSDNMTIAHCRSKALQAGLTLYGLEAGRECWGGENRDRAMTWGRSNDCNWPCGGAECEVCGGDFAIDVYTIPQPDSEPPSIPSPFRPDLLGVPSEPPNTPPTYWDFWPLHPEAPAPSYLKPPYYLGTVVPPVYGSMPPSYGTASPPPTPGAYLLPEHLRPESAYFDARSGLSVFSIPGYEDGIVLLWKDVLVSDRPENLHYFTGSCRSVDENEPGGPAIRMDAPGCESVMSGPLPNWDISSTGAFTAVWIGRFADGARGPQAIMTLSRTPYDSDREIFWTSEEISTYSNGTDLRARIKLPAIPAGQWAMQVISRKPIARRDRVLLSYYSYSPSSGVTKQTTVGSGCELYPDSFALGMDYREQDKAFNGDLAVVLMYNRTLSERQIWELFEFYTPRFGWSTPIV
ncbi:hypothetical protein Vafri_6558 [Volvox africanus]|uniref:WSC domain-containing protein n=1 Tax=Volvox africanus TaxID=51714 RepID=A0A8J4AYI0_9CHLO|nr:hypothetical protein Vafri_6558 [Volvox africanus]